MSAAGPCSQLQWPKSAKPSSNAATAAASMPWSRSGKSDPLAEPGPMPLQGPVPRQPDDCWPKIGDILVTYNVKLNGKLAGQEMVDGRKALQLVERACACQGLTVKQGTFYHHQNDRPKRAGSRSPAGGESCRNGWLPGEPLT